MTKINTNKQKNMKFNNYVDWHKMWEDAIKSHLELYPDSEAFKYDNDECEYSDELYGYFTGRLRVDSLAELNQEDDAEYFDSESNEVTFEWVKNETMSNEDGTEYGGYVWVFTYNVHDKIFTKMEIENLW